METTLIILKPDAVQRGLMGQLLARFEAKGLQVVGGKFMQVPEAVAKQHYAEHDVGSNMLPAIQCDACASFTKGEKWLELNTEATTHKYFAIVDIVFDDLIDITSYEFITANDNTKRDPRAWTFQSEYAGVWTVLDERYDISAPVTPTPPTPTRVTNVLRRQMTYTQVAL